MTTSVSIIIPTKDRYSTLFPVVRALIGYLGDGDWEIVVQDNSTDNSPALMFLNSIACDRLTYRHSSDPVSIVENTVRAIEASSGTYLVFIGDDDIVCPGLCSIVDWLAAEQIECLVYPPAYYWWNSVNFTRQTHFHRPNALWIPRSTSCRISRKAPDREVAYVLEQGGGSFFDLPRLYHGIVRRDVLDRIRDQTGVYVPGASPDMALSMALGIVVNNYVHLDYPVSVFGASRGSGGGRTAERKHHGRLEDQQHLPRETVENWDSRIPRIWSEQTIYAQSVLEVLERFGDGRQLSFASLYAAMLANEPFLARTVAPFIYAYCRQGWGNAARMSKALARKLLGKLKRSVQASTGTMAYDVEIAQNVDECMRAISKIGLVLPIRQRNG